MAERYKKNESFHTEEWMRPIPGEPKKRVVSLIHLSRPHFISCIVSFSLLWYAYDLKNTVLLLRSRRRWLPLRAGSPVRACSPTISFGETEISIFNFPLTRMKPTRIRMCHSLVMNYGLYKKMEIFVRISIPSMKLTCALTIAFMHAWMHWRILQ